MIASNFLFPGIPVRDDRNNYHMIIERGYEGYIKLLGVTGQITTMTVDTAERFLRPLELTEFWNLIFFGTLQVAFVRSHDRVHLSFRFVNIGSVNRRDLLDRAISFYSESKNTQIVDLFLKYQVSNPDPRYIKSVPYPADMSSGVPYYGQPAALPFDPFSEQVAPPIPSELPKTSKEEVVLINTSVEFIKVKTDDEYIVR